jgi:hypothetical protein
MSTRSSPYRRWRLTKMPIVWPVRLSAKAENCTAGSPNEFYVWHTAGTPDFHVRRGKPQIPTDWQSTGGPEH